MGPGTQFSINRRTILIYYIYVKIVNLLHFTQKVFSDTLFLLGNILIKFRLEVYEMTLTVTKFDKIGRTVKVAGECLIKETGLGLGTSPSCRTLFSFEPLNLFPLSTSKKFQLNVVVNLLNVR